MNSNINTEDYLPIPKLPKDRPLTDEERKSFELYETQLEERLEARSIRVRAANNGEYVFRFNGKSYNIVY